MHPHQSNPLDLGRVIFVEDSRSPGIQWALGMALTFTCIAVVVYYRDLFPRALGGDVGLAALDVVLVAAALSGIVVAASRRRAVLYERGLSVPELRLREILRREVRIPLEAIAAVKLVPEPDGYQVWRITTRDGRRFPIWEGAFRDTKAVHEWLKVLASQS